MSRVFEEDSTCIPKLLRVSCFAAILAPEKLARSPLQRFRKPFRNSRALSHGNNAIVKKRSLWRSCLDVSQIGLRMHMPGTATVAFLSHPNLTNNPRQALLSKRFSKTFAEHLALDYFENFKKSSANFDAAPFRSRPEMTDLRGFPPGFSSPFSCS